MNIIVREALCEEAHMIAELTRTCWAEKVAPSSRGHHETCERVLADLRQGGGFLLLLDDKPVGSVRWTPLDDDTDVWEILRLGILPEYRGQNLSEHLLEAVIHQALSASVTELRLAVRADQGRLLDFYAAFGFELAPEIEYSHANPYDPAPSVMRKTLNN